MVFSRLLAKESAVGVDIGSSSIKIVQAEPTKQGIRVSRVAICPTPPNSVKDGVVTNIPEVAAAIQFALRSAGIKAQGAIAAVAGPGVIVRQVKMPKMTEALLRRSIHFEAGKYISAPMEDTVAEFQILGDTDEEGQMHVVLVAAPRTMVDSRVGALEEAGLEPLAMDVEAFAVLRGLVEFAPQPKLGEGAIALLDMGASHTEINLVSAGNLALTRHIPIAGSSLTTAIRNANNCTDIEADQIKHALDLTPLLEPAQAQGRDGDPSLNAIQPLIDELLREIRRSINYYQSQLPDNATETSIDALILTGGTARLKGLDKYTTSRLNVPVAVGNPELSRLFDFSQSPAELNADDIPLLTVGFGLAVKEVPTSAMAIAS